MTNVYDPKKPKAKELYYYSFKARQNGPKACKAEWDSHVHYIYSHIIGPPKASETYTVGQMEAYNLIGIYEKPQKKNK